MAMWLITWSCLPLFNNILLSLLIAFIYYFVFDSSLFWYTKSHLFIIKNWLSFIALMKYISLSSYCNFDIYPSTFHLLKCDLLKSDSIRNLSLFLKPYNCKQITRSSHNQPQPWSVACIIAKKHFQFLQNLKLLKPLYG